MADSNSDLWGAAAPAASGSPADQSAPLDGPRAAPASPRAAAPASGQPPAARHALLGLIAVVAVPLVVFAACSAGDDAPLDDTGSSSYAAYEPTAPNPYDVDDWNLLADLELALARDGASCSDLELWYEAQPGDSNVAIARHYYSACGSIPPPVVSGELTRADLMGTVQPAPAPAPPPPPPPPPCATRDDVTVEASIVDLRPTNDGLDGWLYGVSTTVTSRAQVGVYVSGGLQIDDAYGTWLDYGNFGIELDPGESLTYIDPGRVTYDGRPASAYPVGLAPGDAPYDVGSDLCT